MKKYYAYTGIIMAVFATIAVVFDTFPRSKVSELEKRDLAQFPTFTWDKLFNGTFTKEMSSWFSDSEPFRDELMALSMNVKDIIRISSGEENVSFHAAEDPAAEAARREEAEAMAAGNRNAGAYKNNVTAQENAKIAHAGIIVVGSGDKVRAMMAYGGLPGGGTDFARAVNKYKEVMPQVNVYGMVIPTSVEFYCPEKVKKATKEERLTINNIYSHFNDSVKAVDAYTALAQHAGEDIYLRTDHHWTPLGAFYAARQFAKVARVPFKELSSYERRVVKGFVGSMYGYSRDISVKKAPEDFVYYVPKNMPYSTTYVNYSLDKQFKVTAESRPVAGEYFIKYKDGSGAAYSTFMGGDARLTTVKTQAKTGRKVLVIKDSFGNAVPGYLFYSFDEVHVADFRYFTKDMKQYILDNGITDVLIVVNVFNAYSTGVSKKIEGLVAKQPQP
ncbi:MAG: hypothetical protein IJ844_08780 [Prevotella sp.]|nr:hypothetical protein [Prevotella sp.]